MSMRIQLAICPACAKAVPVAVEVCILCGSNLAHSEVVEGVGVPQTPITKAA